MELTIKKRVARALAGHRGLATDDRLVGYRAAPVRFLTEVLKESPWTKQAQIAQALADQRRVTVRSCNGAGKTWLASRLVLWFLYSRPGSVVVTTAPTWRQVKDQIWRYIRTCHTKARLPGACNQTELSLQPEWYAVGISTDDPTRFQGTHSAAGVLLVVDEASGVPEAIYEAGAGFMTQEESYTLLIGNPNNPAGTFYQSHQRGEWARFHISAADVPPHILSPAYIERARMRATIP
jgi:phage terminase large subunit